VWHETKNILNQSPKYVSLSVVIEFFPLRIFFLAHLQLASIWFVGLSILIRVENPVIEEKWYFLFIKVKDIFWTTLLTKKLWLLFILIYILPFYNSIIYRALVI